MSFKKQILSTKRIHHGQPIFREVLIDTSKYQPHFGKKQIRKLLERKMKHEQAAK